MPQSRHRAFPLVHKASGLSARAVFTVASPQTAWPPSAFLPSEGSTVGDGAVVSS